MRKGTLFFYLIMVCGCASVYRPESRKVKAGKGIPVVRVLIGEVYEVKAKGNRLLIGEMGSGKRGAGFKAGYFKASGEKVWIGERELRCEKIGWPVEITSGNNIIDFNGKSYRGEIIIYQKENRTSEFIVVNRVDVENYLKGVVPCELRTPELEALKVQAIACRSFALAKVQGRSENKQYDLTSGIEDQVYGGMESENELTNRAIDETRGIVCTYNGQIINARYGSTCGGRTQDGGEAYLRSIGCQFCRSSPHYQWEQNYSLEEISKFVGGRVKDLRVDKRDESGRVEQAKVLSDEGNQILRGEELRIRLGLKSRFFDIRRRRDDIIISGRGYGHRVGLCQYGAIGMAKKGYLYESILKYYYKGIRVERIY